MRGAGTTALSADAGMRRSLAGLDSGGVPRWAAGRRMLQAGHGLFGNSGGPRSI